MSKRIPSKIYYLISTGEVILITSEMQGSVESTTKEQDISIYTQLQNYTVNEINYIELPYGTLSSTFKNVKSYSVVNKKLNLVYYTQEELDAIQQEQEAQQAIQDRINIISEYLNLDNNSIDVLENAIIEYETSLITNGVD
jgi:hypothetical protein